MEKTVFRFLAICATFLQYLFLICTFFVFIGIFFTISFKDSITELKIGIDFNQPLVLGFTIYTLVVAILILLCHSFSAKYFRYIMTNLSQNTYFTTSNSQNSLKICLFNIFIVLLQLSINLIQTYFNLNDMSSLFDFSHGSYLTNIIIAICAFSGYLIFKNGKLSKDDSESII